MQNQPKCYQELNIPNTSTLKTLRHPCLVRRLILGEKMDSPRILLKSRVIWNKSTYSFQSVKNGKSVVKSAFKYVFSEDWSYRIASRCSQISIQRLRVLKPNPRNLYVLNLYSQYISLLDSGEDDGNEQECEGQVEQEGIDERLRAVHFRVELGHPF